VEPTTNEPTPQTQSSVQISVPLKETARRKFPFARRCSLSIRRGSQIPEKSFLVFDFAPKVKGDKDLGSK
jgi:hypothetical protein